MKIFFKKDKFEFDELSVTFKVFKFVGLSFEDNSTKNMKKWIKNLHHFYSALVIFGYVFGHTLMTFLFGILDDGPFESKILSIGITFVFFELITKILSIWRNREKIWSTIEEFKVEAYGDGSSLSNAKKCLIKNTKIINFWVIVSYFIIILTQLAPILASMINYLKTNEFLQLYPYQWWLPFEQSNICYGLIYLLQFLIGSTVCSYVFATDALLFLLLSILNCRFEEVAEFFLNQNESSSNIEKLVKQHLSVTE